MIALGAGSLTNGCEHRLEDESLWEIVQHKGITVILEVFGQRNIH